MDTAAAAIHTCIRVVEVRVLDADGALLVPRSAWYGSAKTLRHAQPADVLGRREGLPGQAWGAGRAAGRPIVLKEFEASAFRRTQAAPADGLTCCIALPVFNGNVLSAVVLIFCGDSDAEAGAIEPWRNDAAVSKDRVLDDGCCGSTLSGFEFISRRTAFRKGKGTGLPGLAWLGRRASRCRWQTWTRAAASCAPTAR